MAHPGKQLGVPVDPARVRTIDKAASPTGNVGARSLVSATPAPKQAIASTAASSALASAAPAVAGKLVQVASPHVLAWVTQFVNSTIRPAVAYFGTGWLAEQVMPAEAAAVTKVFGADVVEPVIAWLTNQLVARIDGIVEGDLPAQNGGAALAAARTAMPTWSHYLPGIGRALVDSVRWATKIGGTQTIIAAAATFGGGPITAALTFLAPSFGMLVSNLVGFGIDRVFEMTAVAPEDVPVKDQELPVCLILTAKVLSVGGKLNGAYTATVQLAPIAGQPWFQLGGKADIVIGAERRIIGISKLADATLTIGMPSPDKAKQPIGRLTLTGLRSPAYNEHIGWTIEAATVATDGAARPATLDRLTISPVGWVDGAFHYDGKPGQLGGTAPDGLRWPIAPSAAPAPGDRAAPAAKESAGIPRSGDARSLMGTIHDTLATQFDLWRKAFPLLAAGYLTDHANILASRPDEETATGSGLFAWMADKAGILAGATNVSLVPSFFSSGMPAFGIEPYDLRIGREPSLTFAMRASIQLFAAMPVAHAGNLVVAWLPTMTPSVRLRADEISFGDYLDATGLELDPRGGIRTTRATLRVPLPKPALGLANELAVDADYLSVGPGGIDFRSARAGAKDVRLGKHVTVAEVGVAIQKPGPDPRLAMTVTGGKASFGGEADLAFSGNVEWGGGPPIAGELTATGNKLSAFGNKVTAETLTGKMTLAGEESTLTVKATDAKLAWNTFLLSGSATATLDVHGLAELAVKTVAATLDGVDIGSADDVVYKRGTGIAVGKASLTLPTEGPLRAKAGPGKERAQLVVTAPVTQADKADESDKAVESKPGKKPKKPVEQAPKPAAAPEARSGALGLVNVASVELGPPGTALLTLDFAEGAKQDKADGKEPTPGTLSAKLTAKLGSFQINGAQVRVASSTNARDVRVEIENLTGNGFTIAKATYDDGTLTVHAAELAPSRLFADQLPEAFLGLTTKVGASFAIDTRAGRLAWLKLTGSLAEGTLFGGLATIKELTVKLGMGGGDIGKGVLADGKRLVGQLDGHVTAAAYGVTADLKGTIGVGGGAKTKLSGSGKAGPLAVEITNASFDGGTPTFETAVATISEPGNLIQFRAWKDGKVVPDQVDQIKITATRVVVDAKTGLPVAAANETVEATDKAAPAAQPAPKPPAAAQVVRTKLSVHVPPITVNTNAFVVKVDDFDVDDLAGRTEVKDLTAKAWMNVGLFSATAIVGKVTMQLPGRTPKKASAAAKPKVEADPLPGSVKFEVAEATIGGVVMTGVAYEHGIVSARTATLSTPQLLGGTVATTLGLDAIKWTATDLHVDAMNTTARITSLAATKSGISLGGFLAIDDLTATVTTNKNSTVGKAVLDGWALNLKATGAKLTPAPGLVLAGAAEIDVTKAAGIAGGKLEGATATYGTLGASVGTITVLRDGWSAKAVSIAMGNDTTDIAGLTPQQGVASWLKFPETAWGIRATFDLRKDAAGVHWPTAAERKIEVTKAGFTLPGVSGSFDRTTAPGKASVKVEPLKGEFSLGVKIPFAHGIGLEVGGSVSHEVGIDATGVGLGGGDDLAFAGTLTGRAKLKGRVRIGVYGGVPALFTVSAGLYAGINLSAEIAADASGAWKLPKLPGEQAAGAIEAYLAMKDSKAGAEGTKITAEAGAYASINVVGFGRTIEKPFAEKTIARLHAHGFARLSTVDPIALLPDGEFPKRSFQIDPALEEMFTGGDTTKAIALAQKSMDRGIAKVEAAQELLGPTGPALPAKPADQTALDKAEVTAKGEVRELEVSLGKSKTELDLDRASLHIAELKLADHEKKLAAMKPDDKVSGRAVMNDTLARRLQSYRATFGVMRGCVAGLSEKTTDLTVKQMTLKVAYKKDEIAEFKERIAKVERDDLAKQTQLAAKVTAHEKAARKAELAPKTTAEVAADLARRQARLIQMYSDLKGAYKKAHDHAATKLAEDKKLEIDETKAAARIKELELDKTASATELKFWRAQLTFVQGERDRRRHENEPKHIALSDDADKALTAAKKAKPEAAAALDKQAAADIQVAETAIQAVTDKLMANHRAVGKTLAADTGKREKLEAERGKLLLELEKAQARLAGALQRAAD